MTQIYTSNTVLVKAKAPIVNFTEGNSATMVVDISLVWIDPSSAQRFLTYQWQESNNNGQSWRDIADGVSDHPLSSSNTTPTKTVSVLNNQLTDLALSEFNIATTKPIISSLTVDNVLLSQDNYLYRCIVLLYNNDINVIESVGTSENIFLNISEKKTGHVLPNFDIPWDPMNPRGIIKAGNLSFDQNTTIEIFKLNKDTCGSQWRIIETGYNNVYLSGNITNGVLVGLPTSYGPNDQSYPGYMELQFYCSSIWVTQESWVSLQGRSEHVFNKYGPISPISVSLNGDKIINRSSVGTSGNPLIIKAAPSILGETGSLDITGVFDTSETINVSWNGTALGYAYVGGIIPESFQTITVPASFRLPVNVTITGGVDDLLVVNGVTVTSVVSDPNLNYTFTSSTRTFTVGANNTILSGTGYAYVIAFAGNRISDSSASTNRTDSTNILAIDQTLQSKNITVYGNSNDWTNTGLGLRDTSRIQISTTGSIEWSLNNFSGPSGVSSGNNILYSGIPQSALVGRIGVTGTPFYVGDSYNSFANAVGTLYLSMNDNVRGDNSGSFVSTISYADPDPLGIRVITINPEAYDPITQDQDFDKVTLLAKSDADSVEDLSTNNRSFTSTNVKLGLEISKYGGYSSYYGDSGSSVANSDSSLGFSGDFTIEGWFRFDRNNIGYQGLISTYRDRNVSGWILILETNNMLSFYATNYYITWYWPLTISSNYTPNIDEWIHIVVQRLGSSVKMFANGVEVGSTTNGLDITSGSKIELGNYLYFPGGKKSLDGYIDEIRITKGLARYPQGNPTIPTKSFPKLDYSTTKYIDLSASQKNAVPVYDGASRNILYYTFNTTNNYYVGPYSKPGQISLVYSYINKDQIILPTPTPTVTVTPTNVTPTPTPTVTSTLTPTPTITPSVTTSAIPPSFDPLYNDVVLLLNMSGVNDSKNIVDSSLLNNTISVTGTAAISTTQSRFGGSSLLVPEATSSRNAIYAPASNAFSFGSGNFTIEFWLRQNNTPQSGARVFQTTENNDASSGVDIYYPTNLNSLVVKVSDAASNNVVLSLGATETSSWNHYALVRQNHVFVTYKNGVRIAATNRVLNLTASSGNIVIGGNATLGSNRSVNAYLDDIRITKASRYTGDFTPPVFQIVSVGPSPSPTPTVTPTNTPTA